MKTRYKENMVKVLHSGTVFSGCENFAWYITHKTSSFGEGFLLETFVLQMM